MVSPQNFPSKALVSATSVGASSFGGDYLMVAAHSESIQNLND
jgi:hypothetical protein